MSTESENAESSLEEQLVAYLDGELDAEAVRRIEERLASEPAVREALGRLERTWDLLDELGSTPVGESFTRTTLEMVTVAAEQDVEHAMAEVPVRRRRRLWLIGAGVLAAAAAGFFAAFLALPNSNRQLLQDLPLLENLEEYRQVDDINFLRLMKEKGLASSLIPAESATKERSPTENMPAAEMARWVDNLPTPDKAELLQKKEIFDSLPTVEQAKLRTLRKETQQDQDAAELRRIMHEYYEWWKNLPPTAKNELSSLSSPQERIKRVEQLKQDELRRNPAIILTAKDNAELRDWLAKYFQKFEANHREDLSESERMKWDAQPELLRRQKIADALLGPRRQLGRPRTLPMPDDLSALVEKLSPETRRLLEGKPPEEQWRRIQSWLGAIARQQFAARVWRRPGSLVDENEIAKFFESLPEPERMRLLDLPPDDMQHELQRMYLAGKKPMEAFFGRPPDGPPPGGPRGPHMNPEGKTANKPE
jgi:hypothetical protein